MRKVHFIGIGGIGMSALARYFLSEGWRVAGSDLASSEITEELKEEGIPAVRGHHATNVRSDTELVIYSAAVTKKNPELIAARMMKIPRQSYAEAIGELTKKYFTIAVSGSHGKSTTTALLGLILIEAGLDPTVIVGTKVQEFKNSNFRKGKSGFLVLEADEWNKSFHSYFPKIAVLTNIDNEHLDTYKNFRGVISGFSRYLNNVPSDGIVVANWRDAALRTISKAIARKNRTRVVFYNRTKSGKRPLAVPGAHNRLNAEAAWAAAQLVGVKKAAADAVFKNFKGTWRRLEKLTTHNPQMKSAVFSDYAHHPTEIKATLAALRETYSKSKIVCVFEPHQQDRLTRLFKDFTRAFSGADAVIILPVYTVAGREERGGRDSFALAQELRKSSESVFYAQDFPAAVKLLQNDLRDSDSTIVFMGAGSIDSQARRFFKI